MKPKLPNLLKLMPWISVLVFALLSWYFLMMRNADVLYMQQMRSLFNDTSVFFQQYNAVPAGFLQWAGCYFTQLFYYPALGSGVLILMWIAIFFLMKKAFLTSSTQHLTPLLLIPLVCLLVSEIDLGYWIYYHKNHGYCFSQTIGLLFASLLVCLFRSATSIKFKFGTIIASLLGAVLLVGLYYYIGVYAMAAAAALGIIMLLERRWTSGAFYVIAAIATPFLFRHLSDTMRSEQFFTAGIPVFESGNITNTSLSIPFWIALLMLILFPILNKVGERIKNVKAANIISSLLLVAVTGFSFGVLEDADYDDENYHAECKAYRNIDNMEWEDALYTIRQIQGTLTRQLIVFKNIALFNTGNIGYCMYDYDNKGMTPTPSDSLIVHMANTASPIIYLHHGMTNYAYHYCMEIQVEYGFNITELKVMALSSIINGEKKLAQKYLNILSRTMFHKKWAEHYLPLARNPKEIGKYPELAKINELHSYMSNNIDSDEGVCENYIINYFSDTYTNASKYLQEMCLAYSVISNNIQKFWRQYILYLQLHKGEKIPDLYQQAAYFYLDMVPASSPDPKAYNMQFDQKIIDRYNQFDQISQSLLKNGFSKESIARQTEAEFGDTFWWTYYFNNGGVCY
jgi:hypothetical protein